MVESELRELELQMKSWRDNVAGARLEGMQLAAARAGLDCACLVIERLITQIRGLQK